MRTLLIALCVGAVLAYVRSTVLEAGTVRQELEAYTRPQCFTLDNLPLSSESQLYRIFQRDGRRTRIVGQLGPVAQSDSVDLYRVIDTTNIADSGSAFAIYSAIFTGRYPSRHSALLAFSADNALRPCPKKRLKRTRGNHGS